MKPTLHNSLSPLWTLVTAGLAWGMTYALIEGVGIAASARTLNEIGTSSLLLLSFVTVSGLVFALVSIPAGLVAALIGGLRRRAPHPAWATAIWWGLLSAGLAALFWLDQANLGVTAGLSLRPGFLLPRLAVGLVALVVATLVGAGAYALGRLWQDRLRRRIRIPGRALVAGLWVACALVTVVFSLARGRSRGLAAANSPAAAGTGQTRPNIVILSIDALRADHVGCYGYEKDTTPQIDALAERGIRFENAVSQAPWTLPSFASMFTSLYPTELDIPGAERTISDLRGVKLDPLRTTLAEALHDEGYHTQAVVTNPWLDPSFGFDQGFDSYIRVDKSPTSFSRLDGLFLIQLSRRFFPPGYNALRSLHERIWGRSGKGWDTPAEVVNEYALEWLQGRPREPFFLWVHYIDTHAPYDPPARYMPEVEGISEARFNYLRRAFNQLLDDSARVRPADNRTLIALYDGEARGADEAVGQIVAQLERDGLLDRTIVVLTADHGEEFRDHGGFVHGHSLYQELVHVPLIVAGPEGLLGQPRVVSGTAGLIDLMPTLLTLAGATPPPGLEGHDLLAAASEGGASCQRYTYAEGLNFGPEREMIQTCDYKLILDPYTGDVELYDLQADPTEQVDVGADRPEVVQTLRDELIAWLDRAEQVAAELPRSEAGGANADASLLEELRQGGY